MVKKNLHDQDKISFSPRLKLLISMNQAVADC